MQLNTSKRSLRVLSPQPLDVSANRSLLTSKDKHEVLSILKAYHGDSSNYDGWTDMMIEEVQPPSSPSSDVSLEKLSYAVDDALQELLAIEPNGQGQRSSSSTKDLVDVLNRTIFDLQSFMNTLGDDNIDDIQQLRTIIQSFIDDLSATVRYLLDCRLMSSISVDWVDEEVSYDD